MLKRALPCVIAFLNNSLKKKRLTREEETRNTHVKMLKSRIFIKKFFNSKKARGKLIRECLKFYLNI